MKSERWFLLFLVLTSLGSLPANAGIVDSIQRFNRTIDKESSPEKKVELAIAFIDKIHRNHPDATQSICHRMLPLARKHSNPQSVADLYQYVGVAHAQTGRNDSAIHYYHLAYGLVKRNLPLDKHFEILNRLGIFYLETKDLDSARYYFSLTLKAAEKSGREDELAGVYNNLGIIYHDLGELHLAFANYQKAYQYYSRHEHELMNRALTLNNMALIHSNLGNNEKAVDLFMKAIRLHIQGNALENYAIACSNLGNSYKELGKYDSALHYHTLAWTAALEIKDVFGQARSLMNMGNTYKRQMKFSLALQSYLESMALCKEHSIQYGVLLNNINMGELLSEMGQFAKAITHLNEALLMARQMNLKPMESEVYNSLYTVYEKQGFYEKALQNHVLYHALKDSLDEVARVEEIHKMEASIEAREQQIKNAHLQSQLDQKATRIRNQRIAGGAILLLLLVSTAMLILAIRSRVQLRKTNQLLSELNHEIILKNLSLEEMSAAKDKLFSVVAHDLRSPFNGLLGILSILTEEFDTFPEYKRRQVLLSSYQHAVTTFGLIENLLQWSMSQRDMIIARPGFFDLRQIADVELGVLKGRIDRKKLQVTNSIEPGSSVWVDFDLVRIILRNTINNAIKFTPEGGSVLISSQRTPDHLTVTIRDTGIGMSPEMIQEVFKLSNHHHREGTDREKGSGLGLVIVHDFVKMLQAQIEITSEIGVGTTISLHFPVRHGGTETTEATQVPNA